MKNMKIWSLLIIIGLSFGINSAMAAEKFNLCVYDISFGVKGASIESGSRIEKMATDYFKARPDIKVISKKDFKSYVSNKLKVKKAGEKELLDIAKFAGLDLLVFLKASGDLSGDVSLEDLFGEDNTSNLKLNIKIYDVYQGAAVFEEESVITNLSEVKKSIGDMLSKFDFPIKRGKVKKVEDNKVAVNIGLDDGIDAGQTISIFKAESKIKIGSSEIIPVGDKLAEGTVEKAIDAMSLIALNETAEVRVGDYAEAII
ncbi:MAG: hypothetical protein WC624_07105, partial [Candidatus Margulisiibacteriota bacterium]